MSENPKTMQDYSSSMNSRRWKLLKESRVLMANSACEACGSRHIASALVLHHKHYNSIGKETQDDVSLLCRGCHKKLHVSGKCDATITTLAGYTDGNSQYLSLRIPCRDETNALLDQAVQSMTEQYGVRHSKGEVVLRLLRNYTEAKR